MLPIDNRLKKKRDFDLLMSKGRWINGQFFDLKFLKLDKAVKLPKNFEASQFYQQLKIAFAVSLKISKLAVKRNRLRRLMREVVRLLMIDNHLSHGYYLIFVAKKDSLNLSLEDIFSELELLLKKAKIWL